MTNGIYLLSGSNLGDRVANMARALEFIEQEVGRIIAQSQLYETAAWGIEAQPSFLNQVMEIASTLPPMELLNTLLSIEKMMGRERRHKWGERLIDLDLLYYADWILDEPALQIPHPHLQDRRFTLVPLCELAPLLVHPVLKKNQLELLEACPDQLEVRVFNL